MRRNVQGKCAGPAVFASDLVLRRAKCREAHDAATTRGLIAM